MAPNGKMFGLFGYDPAGRFRSPGAGHLGPDFRPNFRKTRAHLFLRALGVWYGIDVIMYFTSHFSSMSLLTNAAINMPHFIISIAAFWIAINENAPMRLRSHVKFAKRAGIAIVGLSIVVAISAAIFMTQCAKVPRAPRSIGGVETPNLRPILKITRAQEDSTYLGFQVVHRLELYGEGRFPAGALAEWISYTEIDSTILVGLLLRSRADARKISIRFRASDAGGDREQFLHRISDSSFV